MKTFFKIPVLAINVVLLFAVFTIFTVGKVDAGCYCKMIPGLPPTTPNTEKGIRVDTTDGGTSCMEMYGVDGIPEASIASMSFVGNCDPFSAALDTGFKVPTFSQIIGNVIRLIFFIAGLFALVYLLLGGFEWVQSAGDEKKLTSARNKITNAIIGLVVMIAVLSLVIFLEQVVFGGKICLGISCPINVGFLKLIR